MCKHPFKHCRKAVLWHSLVFILKIAVVVRDYHRHAARDLGTDFLRLLSPLLHGIFQKNILINILRNLPNLRILIFPKLHNRNPAALAVSRYQLLLQNIRPVLFINHMQRIQIEGNRDKLFSDLRHHLMAE